MFDIIGGGTPSTAVREYWDGSISWISSADIDEDHRISPRRYITEDAIHNSATNKVPANSVIVVTRVGLGKVAIAPTDLCFSQDSQALLFNPNLLDPAYVLHHMGQAVTIFKHISRGTTISGVTKKQLATLAFLVPPHAEQRRIIAEIEKQLTRLDAAVAALKRVQAHLKRYRAAVLKAACEGRLVPTEAELARKEGRPYETGEQLLARMRLELSPASLRRGIPDAVELSPSAARLKVPEGWALVSVSDLLKAGALTDVKDGNHGSNHPRRDEFSAEGLPFITAEQVNGFAIDYDSAPRVAGAVLGRLKVGFARPGDVVLTHKGTIGRVALCDRDCVLTPQTTYYRVNCAAFDPEYLMFHHATPQFYAQLADVKSQTTRDYVPISDQYRLFVLVPPRAEQERIKLELDRQLSVALDEEHRVSAQVLRADRLRQSIMKHAFEGKLVQQDPNDEPASVLLERIRAERTANASSRQTKGSTRNARSGR